MWQPGNRFWMSVAKGKYFSEMLPESAGLELRLGMLDAVVTLYLC